MMEKYEIQKLRELPIEKVAKEMGMKVEHHKALCPFHDDHHASLTFNETKNSCRCYVCMSNFIGTIDLAMRYLGRISRRLADGSQKNIRFSWRRILLRGKTFPLGGLRAEGLLRALHPMVLLRVIIRGNLPSMQAGMRDFSSIPGQPGSSKISLRGEED